MARTEASVEELVSMVERGELRLPEMHRRYVWRSTRVRDLLDSLYRGYPSGAILLWETDDSHVLLSSPFITVTIVLDGHKHDYRIVSRCLPKGRI